MKIVNFVSIRNSVSRFMKNDKLSGIKKAWYFHHIQLNQAQAMDTRVELQEQLDLYAQNNIKLYKTIKPSAEAIRRAGARDVTLYVYRNDNDVLQRANNLNGEFVVDTIAVAFDYLPAECELCIAEVVYQKNTSTQPKKKRK